MNHRLYYLAQAAVASFPQTLHWLSRAGDKDSVLAEWNHATPRQRVSADAETRRLVASLFEDKRDYRNAFNVYLSLADSEKAIETFALAYPLLPRKERWVCAKSLYDQLVDRGLLLDAIEQIRKYFADLRLPENDKLAVGIKLLRACARSKSVPDQLSDEQRELIEEMATAAARVSERRAISNREIGFALERMARHVTALRFYEAMLRESESNVDDREWAKRRWVFTKLKQVAYFERLAGDNRALAIQLRQVGLATTEATQWPRTQRGKEAYKELRDKALEWDIPIEIPKDDEYPDLAQRADPVEGLPAGTQLEALSSDKWKFQIGTLEVLFDRAAKRVILMDRTDLAVVEIDAANLRVNVLRELGLEQKRTENGDIEFSIPERNWRGSLKADESCIDLDLAGSGGPINIQLRPR